MNRLYIINGKAGSGKDTFVKLCDNYLDPDWDVIRNLHSSDRAKEALALLGYTGNKTAEERQLLADMTMYGQSHGISEQLIGSVRMQPIVFFHERNPKEIGRLKQLYPQSKTILVVREDLEEFESDIWGIHDYMYDRVILNNGTLEELKQQAIEFCKEEGLLL